MWTIIGPVLIPLWMKEVTMSDYVSVEESRVDWRRVLIYIAFSFGIAWLVALVIYRSGGLANSTTLFGAVPLAGLLLALAYMPAPAIAHLLTRVITGEGWQDLKLKPNFKRGWTFWLIAWLGTAFLALIGSVVYFAIYPGQFDPEMNAFFSQPGMEAAAAQLAAAGISPMLFALIQTVQAILIAPVINSVFTLGEEFGWRAYLQPHLMPLGGRVTMLLMGLIWGLWHAPIILMGHNYGLVYPGAPVLGPLAMIGFCFTVGTFFGWATLKGGSVWPAVIGHAMLNGIAALPTLFLAGDAANPVLGPAATGVIGGLGFIVVMVLLFVVPGALEAPPEPEPGQDVFTMAPAAEDGKPAG